MLSHAKFFQAYFLILKLRDKIQYEMPGEGRGEGEREGGVNNNDDMAS